MAITKIHAIKGTLAKALAYVENPAKTDDMLLVSGYECDPYFASAEFTMTQELARSMRGDSRGNALAYHMIQSFAPFDTLTPEEAHELGKQWADELLGGKYEYVITTHVDKGHIHNHIIFNATSFVDYKKFESVPYKTVARLREVSDRLCAERGLHVNKPKEKGEAYSKDKGTSYKAWQREQQLRRHIDNAIAAATDYNHFKQMIKQRIEQKHVAAEPRTVAQEVEDAAAAMPSMTRLAYAKQLMNAMVTIRREEIASWSDFDVRAAGLNGKAEAVRGTVMAAQQKSAQYKAAAKLVLAYQKYAPIAAELETRRPGSKQYQSYAATHDGELRAYQHAKAQLEKLGLRGDIDINAVLERIQANDLDVASLADALSATERRISDLKTARDVAERVTGRGAAGRAQERTPPR